MSASRYDQLLNHTDNPEHRILGHAVPTRVLRMVQTDAKGCTFRVEHLKITTPPHHPTPKGAWHLVHIFTNPQPFGPSYDEAWMFMAKEQANMVKKVHQRMRQKGLT